MNVRRTFAQLAFFFLAGSGPVLGVPAISSFNPTFGASNDPSNIIITGSGFSPGVLVVKFNGVQDTTAAASTANQILARVPPGATNGSGPIFVSVNGSPTFSSQPFTVIGPGPYVANFSPQSGGGGLSVTLNGAHFIAGTTVTFNGVGGGITSLSQGQIQVNTPAGVTTGPIRVTSSQGTFTTTSNFFAPPTISGFSPSFGRTGTNVTITGNNFIGTTAVTINGLPVSFTPPTTNTILLVTVPPNATTGPILVSAPAGAALTSSNFVVRPTISGFTPGLGPVGTPLVITGANLNVGSPTVTFSGASPVAGTSPTFNSLNAVVPAGAVSGPVTVTTTDGSMTSTQLFYLPAAITSFTPTNSPPGTWVRINGSNFTNATAVTFNGAPASNFHVTNTTVIGAQVPPGVSTGPIQVTTPAGVAISAGLFYGAPVINSFDPTHGLPGTNVLISGTNFLGASAVLFNGLAASFVVANNGAIGAVVPSNAQTGPITIVAPAGSNTTAASFVLDYTANVSVTVTDAPDPVFVGSNLVYTISVLNSGPFDVPNMMLSNTLPAGVIVKSVSPPGILTAVSNLLWGNIGTVTNGFSRQILVTVAPQVTGLITNRVSAFGSHPDPNPANNTNSTTTLVWPFPTLAIELVSPEEARVSWPLLLSNFTLQSKTTLSPGLWTNDNAPRTILGPNIFITETNFDAMKFYRLTN